jgi:hypothetical protein
MFNFIHPIDESTEFLSQIYITVSDAIGSQNITINAYDDDKHSEDIKQGVLSLPENSNVIFLGHGRSDRLYSILEVSNEALFSTQEMAFFNGKNLLALACQSAELLKSTYPRTKIKNSIGFGYLPTSQAEVLKIRDMKSKGTSDDDIEHFKNIIVSSISTSLINTFKYSQSFYYMNNLLRLILHKEMTNSVLEKNSSGVANLIYQMCYQMNYMRS